MKRQSSRALAIAKSKYVHPSDEPRQRFLTSATGPDLQVVLASSLIGLLLTLNIMFRVPDIGAILAQSSQF